jgi:RNA polymerase sigma-70 factor (ECF subfamily)
LRLARLEDERPDAMEQMLRAEQQALVRQILEELPVERDRDLLRRYYLGQESKERIQADHRLTSLQFNRVLHRARKRFQELWEARQSGSSKHL